MPDKEGRDYPVVLERTCHKCGDKAVKQVTDVLIDTYLSLFSGITSRKEARDTIEYHVRCRLCNTVWCGDECCIEDDRMFGRGRMEKGVKVINCAWCTKPT